MIFGTVNIEEEGIGRILLNNFEIPDISDVVEEMEVVEDSVVVGG